MRAISSWEETCWWTARTRRTTSSSSSSACFWAISKFKLLAIKSASIPGIQRYSRSPSAIPGAHSGPSSRSWMAVSRKPLTAASHSGHWLGGQHRVEGIDLRPQIGLKCLQHLADAEARWKALRTSNAEGHSDCRTSLTTWQAVPTRYKSSSAGCSFSASRCVRIPTVRLFERLFLQQLQRIRTPHVQGHDRPRKNHGCRAPGRIGRTSGMLGVALPAFSSAPLAGMTMAPEASSFRLGCFSADLAFMR